MISKRLLSFVGRWLVGVRRHARRAPADAEQRSPRGLRDGPGRVRAALAAADAPVRPERLRHASTELRAQRVAVLDAKPAHAAATITKPELRRKVLEHSALPIYRLLRERSRPLTLMLVESFKEVRTS